MNRTIVIRSLTAVIVIFSVLALTNFTFQTRNQQERRGERPEGQGDKPVELVKKNIQVLKGLPASQLIPVMNLIKASLNVDCEHCHVVDSSGWKYELDEKREKNTARKMIQMVMDVNKEFFDGRHEVTCFTCHRGTTDPASIISLSQILSEQKKAPEREERPKLPKTTEVISKYENALGGSAALAKISSRVTKGVNVGGQGREMPFEVYQKAPNKYVTSMTFGNFGSMSRGFDGTTGWMTGREGARMVSDAEKGQMEREAQFFPLQRMQKFSDSLRVRAVDTVNGKASYVLVMRAGDGSRERYYIDTTSGLLLRRVIVSSTPIGDIPDQVDYDDYRVVDGVKIPFAVKVSAVDQRSDATRRVTSVEQNTSIDDGKFAMPAGKK
jgi:hypothetical protein